MDCTVLFTFKYAALRRGEREHGKTKRQAEDAYVN